MIDLHIHSRFSPDSSSNIKDIVSYSKIMNLKVIGISDHIEVKNWKVVNDFNHNEFFREVERHNNGLLVLKGVELGWDFTYKYEDFDGFDYVMLSVHEYNSKLDVYNCYKEYLLKILRCTKEIDFQILGHLDYPRRYMKGNPNIPEELLEIVKEILKMIKEKNASLEVNSKPITLYNEPHPDVRILKIAYQMDVDVTIGSDAHEVGDIGKNIKSVIELLKDIGFKKLVFFKDKRKEAIRI